MLNKQQKQIPLSNFKTLNDFKTKENLPYFDFLETLINKVSVIAGDEMHIHHIIPEYVFKKNPQHPFVQSKENKILINKKDHCKAHQILFETCKDPRDKGAFSLLSGDFSEAIRSSRQAGAAAVHAQLKKKGKNFWNKEWQEQIRILNKADPKVRSSRAEAAYKRWKGKVVSEKDQFLWFYKGEETICSFWCSSCSEIDIELQKIQPSQKTEVSRIISGENKSSGNWKGVKVTEDQPYLK